MAALQCEICGGKLMAKAGGLFECEYCGMQYDKTRIQEMVQEIKGTVKVEGTVEVTGTVKVEGGVSLENLLTRGRLALEDGNWHDARRAFQEALNLNAECAEAYLGLAMCQEQAGNLEKLVNAQHWKDKHYCRGKQFADDALLKQLEELEQACLARVEKNEEERITREKDIYSKAACAIFETGQASVSMLQRKLKLSYASAGRYIDELEELGLLGPFRGGRDREILMSVDTWNETCKSLGIAPVDPACVAPAEEKSSEKITIDNRPQQWRNAGLCQHCGGELKGVFFLPKCVSCGKPKDY